MDPKRDCANCRFQTGSRLPRNRSRPRAHCITRHRPANATLGFVLKIITFPLSILTLGLVLLVINALMIELASSIVRGFHVQGFWPAFWGGIVLSLIGMLIRAILKE